MVRPRTNIKAVTLAAALLVAVSVGAINQAQAGTSRNPARSQTTQGIVTASSPDGWIGQEASYLSGRSLTVICDTTNPQWAQTIRTAGLPAAQADEYYALSYISKGEMRLSPYVCDGLKLGTRPSTRESNTLQVAWAVDVLIHESTHMARRTTNEAISEACARTGLPNELNRLYGIPYHTTQIIRLTSAAKQLRRTMTPAYQNGVCAQT